MSKKAEQIFENLIFASRWIQAPLYAGLGVAGLLYAYKFLEHLAHMVLEVGHVTEEVVMLGVLTLVDITMVANLLVMVIVGGYSTFVSRIDLEGHEDRPDWLQKISAGTLKVKLAGALAGISGIHLLKAFININNLPANAAPGTNPYDAIKWQIIIHVVFLFSTLMLAYTEKVLHSAHEEH